MPHLSRTMSWLLLYTVAIATLVGVVALTCERGVPLGSRPFSAVFAWSPA